nr:unnamed protein product [Spirometra erinaceieuropaei]
MLQRALLLLLTSVLAIADNPAQTSFGGYEISQSLGPYTLQVPISNETSEVTFTIDEDVFRAVNGTCQLNSSIAFAFPCPVECSLQQCHVNINLPEVSFFEILMVKVNETHEDLYIHDVPSFDSVRPVFTQERGPLIFTTLLPGMPKFVYIQPNLFDVQTQKGTCVVVTTDGPIRCKVVQVGKYYRMTVFFPEIQGITEFRIASLQPNNEYAKYWLNVEHISVALLPNRTFIYENGSLSKKSENETELELVWPLQQLPVAVDVSQILCFSVSQDICGYPHSCVSETENNRTVMRYKAKQGKERMSFYTCEYRKHYQYDIVSYRHHWSGLDDFRGKNKAWQSASSVIELKWLLNYRGSPEQQHLECLLNGKPLCSGVTTTSQWGKCHLTIDGQSYAFIHVAKRTAATNISRYVCRTESDSQTHTIYWHVDSHSGNVAPLLSACTYVLATAGYGTHVCPASICLVAVHCLYHAPGRYSACTMRGFSLPFAWA